VCFCHSSAIDVSLGSWLSSSSFLPIAAAFGVLEIERLEYARPSRPALRVVVEGDELEAAASILKAHVSEAAPPAILAGIRTLLDSAVTASSTHDCHSVSGVLGVLPAR
jgi:hypothetical protein